MPRITDPLFIDVIITHVDDPDKIHDRRKINYHSDRARKWLANACYFAFNNGLAVHTARAQEI